MPWLRAVNEDRGGRNQIQTRFSIKKSMFRSTLPLIARARPRVYLSSSRPHRLFSSSPSGSVKPPSSHSPRASLAEKEALEISILSKELRVPLSHHEIELLNETVTKEHGGRWRDYAEMITSKRFQREVRQETRRGLGLSIEVHHTMMAARIA